MKKYIILAAAAVMALAACTKTEIAPESQREISFQVASRLQTKATGVLYNNGAFGTYAWFNATDEFMVNEQVDKLGSVWKTVDNTFYWPKTGSIDFISYSPFAGTSNTAGTVPVVTSSKITYTGLTAGTQDIMYADKVTVACATGADTDDIYDNGLAGSTDSGYNGVPTLFRHALAKLSFKIKANFVEYDDATNGSHTEWEVTVNSIKISGFKTTGNCELEWESGAWKKPVTHVANPNYDATDPNSVEFFDCNVWTNLSGTSVAQELLPSGAIVLTTTPQDLNPASGFVMPQILVNDAPSAPAQKLTMDIHIKTTLSNGKTINEDLVKVVDIKDISSLHAWEMNQNIVYTISIKPTAKDTTNGQDNTPEDVVITFDPAVADWTNVDASATIQL